MGPSEGPSPHLVPKTSLDRRLKSVFDKNGLSFSEREQCFLMSLFDQNQRGECDVREVGRILFDEDIEAYFGRKQKRPKGPFFELPLNDLKLTAQQKKNLKRNRTFDRRRLGRDHSVLQNCRAKLQRVLGNYNRNHFDKWRFFDADRDGHVGLGDIRQRLLQMGVFSQGELTYLVDHFGQGDASREGGPIPFRQFQLQLSNLVDSGANHQDLSEARGIRPLLPGSSENFNPFKLHGKMAGYRNARLLGLKKFQLNSTGSNNCTQLILSQ